MSTTTIVHTLTSTTTTSVSRTAGAGSTGTSTAVPAWRRIPGIPPTFTHPAELDPHYVPQDIRKELLVVGLVTFACAAVTAAMRLWAKFHFRQKIEWADWLMVPATVRTAHPMHLAGANGWCGARLGICAGIQFGQLGGHHAGRGRPPSVGQHA